MEITGMKNMVGVIKNMLEGLISRAKAVEDRVSDLEYALYNNSV